MKAGRRNKIEKFSIMSIIVTIKRKFARQGSATVETDTSGLVSLIARAGSVTSFPAFVFLIAGTQLAIGRKAINSRWGHFCLVKCPYLFFERSGYVEFQSTYLNGQFDA